MKPVFAIIDEKERDDFEKKWGLPYGYFECDLFYDLDEAIIEFEDYVSDWETSYIIEKVDSEGREVAYKR